MDNWCYSECCGASPDGSVEDIAGDLIGICSECNDWAQFFDDDEFMDWEDEKEYILEHLE
jgi:hypothetical protein